MRALRDLAWILGAFVVLGVLAGLIWWQVATPPYYVRTAQGAVMDQAELAKRVQADGRFAVIGAVAGIGAGLALVRLRRDSPVLVVLAGALAAAGAGWLALALGRLLGHVDVSAAVRAAPVGGHVTESLNVISPLVLLAWPIGYLLAVVTVLWGTGRDEPTSDDKTDDFRVAATPGG